MNLTVVVPFWNGHATLERLLASIPADLPVVVVDDHSDVPPPASARYRVIRPPEKGYFTGAVNAGLAACPPGADVLVLNQDAELQGTAWREMLDRERGRYAYIGERIKGHHPAWPEGYIHGTFTFIRRDLYDAIGPMNAVDYPLWGSTCEYQLRGCRKGFKALPLPAVPGLVHDRPGKFGAAITEALRRTPDRKDWFIRTPPMISVVVPCYNYGRYLADCLHSLIGGPTSLGPHPGQSFQSFEVIIVDDASPDPATWPAAQALVDPWQGIRAIRLSENKGTAGALNAGVAAALGRYIYVVSADDMVEPWALERHLRAVQAHPHSVAYGNLQTFGQGQRRRVLTLPAYDFDLLLEKNPMPACMMYERAAWVEVGGYPEVMRYGREDWAFNIRLGAAGYCGVHIGDGGNLYRREGQNRSLRTGNVHAGEGKRQAGYQWRGIFREQLQALYPNLYAGERPMGCCGDRRTTNPAPARGAVQTAASSASAGMVFIEYIGGNAGNSTWWGPVTRTKYVFGGGRKVGQVYAEDAAGLLALRHHTKPVFRRYQMVKAQPVLPKEAVVAALGPVPATANKPVVVPEPASAPPDDLTRVKGVGVATAEKLLAAGYRTYRDLALADPAEVAERAELPAARAHVIVKAAVDHV